MCAAVGVAGAVVLPAAACRTRVEATLRSLGLSRNASWLLLVLLLPLVVLAVLVAPVLELVRLPHRLRVVKRQAPVDSTQYTSPASASVVQMPDTCSTLQQVKQGEIQPVHTRCQLGKPRILTLLRERGMEEAQCESSMHSTAARDAQGYATCAIRF